ncbi:hypothetical protein MPSEU_000444600 [Mayamaea pseudoterrestris]|nr:hypothetical protein MPSEU_000444600 [Mayamaea pseudoterrestris]
MRAFKLFLSFMLPAIAVGLLESTMSEEGVVPDEEVAPEANGFNRQLSHRQGPPGLSTYIYRGPRGNTGGSKGTKGSKGASQEDCATYRVYYDKREYRRNLSEISTGRGSKGKAIGYTVDRLNLSDARTGRVVGFVTETNLITGTFDCTANGALSFGRTPAGKTSDQLFYQGTCSTQIENSVTGGTGDFQCAAGTARVFRRTPTRIYLEISVCGTCTM